MPRKPKPFARIAVTLPPDVLALANQLARRLDRSRSWVVAEAIRRLVETPEPQPRPFPGGRERVAAYTADPFASARVAHLRDTLALSPADRLRRAEELRELSRLAHPRPLRRQIIAFQNWDDFAAWKHARRIGL